MECSDCSVREHLDDPDHLLITDRGSALMSAVPKFIEKHHLQARHKYCAHHLLGDVTLRAQVLHHCLVL